MTCVKEYHVGDVIPGNVQTAKIVTYVCPYGTLLSNGIDCNYRHSGLSYPNKSAYHDCAPCPNNDTFQGRQHVCYAIQGLPEFFKERLIDMQIRNARIIGTCTVAEGDIVTLKTGYLDYNSVHSDTVIGEKPKNNTVYTGRVLSLHNDDLTLDCSMQYKASVLSLAYSGIAEIKKLAGE